MVVARRAHRFMQDTALLRLLARTYRRRIASSRSRLPVLSIGGCLSPRGMDAHRNALGEATTSCKVRLSTRQCVPPSPIPMCICSASLSPACDVGLRPLPKPMGAYTHSHPTDYLSQGVSTTRAGSPISRYSPAPLHQARHRTSSATAGGRFPLGYSWATVPAWMGPPVRIKCQYSQRRVSPGVVCGHFVLAENAHPLKSCPEPARRGASESVQASSGQL